MTVLVLSMFAICTFLIVALVGLREQLKQAEKDAAAWKAIALAIDDTYVRVPTFSRTPTGREMRH